ncbi:MAG: hypothetical protein V4597_11780 [Pseudomonadota bacterium]
MNEYTPAPWHVQPGGTLTDVASGPIGMLAYVSTAGARGRTLDEAQANARLIAAAPDLLATLRQLVADWDSVDERAQVPDEINDDDHWAAARAAIARATVPTP